MIDNVGSLSAGSYHGPPYQFDTSDFLMVDCAAGCTGTGTANTFTASQTFQGSPPIILSNGTNTENIGFDGTFMDVPRIKITTQFSLGGNTQIGVAKIGTNTACGPTNSPVTSSSLNNLDCKVTAVTSSAVLNFGTAYGSPPVCTASDETTAGSLKVVVTTSSVTVTTPGASDLIDIICFGNGGV